MSRSSFWLLALAVCLAPVVRADMTVGVQDAPTAQSPGTQPDTNGIVIAAEYFDGKQFPLQNYYLSSSASDGRGFITVSANEASTGWGDHCERYGGTNTFPCFPRLLHVGLELPVFVDEQDGWIEFLIDSRRDETFGPANYPRDDDRRVLVTYDNAVIGGGIAGATLQQFKGTDNAAFPGWVPVDGTPDQWLYFVFVSNPPGGPLMAELLILLTPEIVSTSQKFGLGIQHVPPPGLAVPPPFHQLPNVAQRFDTRFPSQWETVNLQDYDPIPMEYVTYNIGQMPTVWLCPVDPVPPDDVAPFPPGPCFLAPLADGGEGEPTHFADILWDREAACLQEVWSRADREELIDEINSRRSQHNLPPVDSVGGPPADNPDGDGKSYVTVTGLPYRVCLWQPYGLVWHCDDIGVDQYTGLLLLSGRGMLERGVFEFGEAGSGQCYGDFSFILADNFNNDFDCAQDKGMLWGRVMTEAAIPIVGDTGLPGEAYDTSQVIDLFCTHADTGSDPEDLAAREADFAQLKIWIDSVRLPDRPALLAGDMNTDWHTFFGVQPASFAGSPDYQMMKTLLGIDQPSFFDSLNTTFSDVYDVAAVDVSGDRIGTDPTLTFNTVLGECSPQTEANMNSAPVIDYIFLLPPPTDENTFPNFVVKKDPAGSVDPHYRANVVPLPDECLSDHAMLQANFELAQTYEPGKWNPARTHAIRHSIPSLWDFEEGAESDSDWFSDDHWVHVGSGPGSWSASCNSPHSSGSTCDGSNCPVNWSSCDLNASGTDFAGAMLVVDDEEGVGVFNYDTSPHGPAGARQRNMHFVLDHFAGSWIVTDDSWSSIGGPQFYDDTNPPPDQKTFELAFPKEGDGWIGSEETDYRARATHRLRAQEQ